MKRVLVLLGLMLAGTIAGCATTPPLPTTTETLTWTFTNHYPRTVLLEFYSQNRDAAWPGGSRGYVLDDRSPRTYSLSCRTGEKICYGAWVERDPSTYWGAGMADEHGCSNCCRICATADAGHVTLEP